MLVVVLKALATSHKDRDSQPLYYVHSFDHFFENTFKVSFQMCRFKNLKLFDNFFAAL